jgi:hypothetical protein
VQACYDCLLSYSNQREHKDLSRFAAKPLLELLAQSSGELVEEGGTPAERYNRLAACAGEQERAFLRFLFDGGYDLPDAAGRDVEGVRVPFFYERSQACVFLDGDAAGAGQVRKRLERQGYEVVALDDLDAWPAVVQAYDFVFGKGAR